MEAVRCELVNDHLLYTCCSLPLDRASCERDMEALRQAVAPALYCIPASTEEALRMLPGGFISFYHFSDKHSFGKDLRAGLVQYLNSKYKESRDPDAEPVKLLKPIRQLLRSAMQQEHRALFLVGTGDVHFAWMKKRGAWSHPGGLGHGGMAQPAADGAASGRERVADAASGHAPFGHPGQQREHPHASGSRVCREDDPAIRERYKFIGGTYSYLLVEERSWGSFFAVNPRREKRSRALQQDRCEFCAIAGGMAMDRPAGSFRFGNEDFIVTGNENPIVTGQYIVFPASRQPHRRDVTENDVALMLELLRKGTRALAAWPTALEGGGPAWPVAGDGSVHRPPAVYVNVFPGSGRSQEHMHLNCVYPDLVPLPPWPAARWSLAGCDGIAVARLNGAPFYALTLRVETAAVDGRGGDERLAAVMHRLHGCLNELRIPYNLIAVPPLPNRGAMLIVVPRRREQAEGTGINPAGLEFMTGVLLASDAQRDAMDTVLRDRVLRSVTFGAGDILPFERQLRRRLGMPHAGSAVVTERDAEGRCMVRVRSNALYAPLRHGPQLRWWTGRDAEDDAGAHPLPEPRVLVRPTHASITRADVRTLARAARNGVLPPVVAGHNDGGIIAGHNGGGIVVDPGPHADLRPGDKVVILPRQADGVCDACRALHTNRCEHPRKMGQDIDGCLATVVAVPRDALLPVHAAFPDGALPLVVPLARVLRMLFLVGRHFGRPAGDADHIAVFGARATGCLAALALQQFWPGIPVGMVDPDERRLAAVAGGNIAARTMDRVPEGEQFPLCIVASHAVSAFRDASAAVRPGGAVVFCSDPFGVGPNAGGPTASVLRSIRRGEEARPHGGPATGYTLIGSKGYEFDDLRRAASALASDYTTRYARVQNVLITAIDAPSPSLIAPMRSIYIAAAHDAAVQACLAPLDHPDEQALAEESLTVLVHI